MGAWRRLPCYFPNIDLRMLPLPDAELNVVKKTGWLRKVAFRTTPNVSKVRSSHLRKRPSWFGSVLSLRGPAASSLPSKSIVFCRAFASAVSYFRD